MTAPDASTSPVEWGPYIVVDRKRPFWLDDGEPMKLILPQALGGDRETTVQEQIWWPHITAICLRADHPFYAKNAPKSGEPTTPERDPALWDRMEALVRDMGETYRKADTPAELPTRNYDMRHYQEARNIQNLLPKPVDPDLIEAREMEAKQSEANGFHDYAANIRAGKDDDGAVRCRYEGIKRGRELAAPEVSHVG